MRVTLGAHVRLAAGRSIRDVIIVRRVSGYGVGRMERGAAAGVYRMSRTGFVPRVNSVINQEAVETL